MGKYILSLKANNNGLIKNVGGDILSNTGIYTETGKFGNKAIEVYSNTNYVQVYPSDDISTNEDFTISLWMKSLDTVSSISNDSLALYTRTFGLVSGTVTIYLNYDGSWRFIVTLVNGDSIQQGFNSFIWDDLLWHHIAITRKNGVIRLYLDGSLTSPDYEYGTATTSGNGYLLEDWFLPSTTVIALSGNSSYNQDVTHILFDDVTILKGEALWYDSSFTLPSTYLFSIKYAFLSSNSVYTGTNLTKISNSWSTLSNAEKEALVPSFSNNIPSIPDLASISPFRVLINDTSSSNVKVTGQPKPQTIEPTSLINTGAVSTIQSINITNTITDTTVKFAITTNLTTYKVYDASQGTWVTSTNIEEDGMSIAQINALTPQILSQLDISNGIAFKQCFIATSENASAELSEISAVVDIDGSWSQSVHGTDYNVAYPNKTTMSVRLLINGDYIINYPIASGGGAVTLPLDYVVRFRATDVGVKDLVIGNKISIIGSAQPIIDTDFYDGVALKCANNSYVKIVLSSPFEVNGLEEFTISCFVKCSSVNTWEPLFGKGGANYGPGIWISYNGAFTPWFRAVDDTSVTVAPNISCSMNVVHHIALVKAGNTMSLYVDGVLSNSTTYTSTIDFGSYITIGAIGTYYSTAEINDLCIIRNKALWLSNFAPPINYLPDNW